MKVKIDKQLIEEMNRFEKHLKNKSSNYQMEKRRDLNNSLRRSDPSIMTSMNPKIHNFNALNLVHLKHGDKINKNLKISKEFNNDLKLASRESNNVVKTSIDNQRNSKTKVNDYTLNKLRKKKKLKNLGFLSPTAEQTKIYSGGDALNFKKELNGANNSVANHNNISGIWVHPTNKDIDNGLTSKDFKDKDSFMGERHRAYAGRALNYGGVPAELTGDIPTHKLNKVENGYEAMISDKTLKNKEIVKNLKITKLPISRGMIGQMAAGVPNISNKYSEKYGYSKIY